MFLPLGGRDLAREWEDLRAQSATGPVQAIYREEIFGPVLCVVCVNTLDEAIELINNSPYGNGTSIFTASGAAARKYTHEITVR